MHAFIVITSRQYGEGVRFAMIATIVFISRIPFIDAGFGVDPDTARVINTARAIAATGAYSAARLPGNPAQEILYACIADAPIWVFNVSTAALSAIAVAFFALTLKRLGVQRWVAPSLFFAFTPVVYINSVASMDYIWALAFALAALYSAVRGQTATAGILLGLAVGFRLTSLIMALPIAMMAWYVLSPKRQLRDVIIYSVAMFFSAALCYLPTFLQYGLGFLAFTDSPAYNLFHALYRASGPVWGWIGAIAVALGGICILWRICQAFRRRRALTIVDTPYIAAGVAILFYLFVFVRLPHESGYLIPAVPFVFLLFEKYLPAVWFYAIGTTVAAASFFFSITPVNFYMPTPNGAPRFTFQNVKFVVRVNQGEFLYDYAKRKQRKKIIQSLIELDTALPHKALILAGPWQPFVTATLYPDEPRNIKYCYLIDSAEAEQAVRARRALYYLPWQRKFNMAIVGLDIHDFGAKPLIECAEFEYKPGNASQ